MILQRSFANPMRSSSISRLSHYGAPNCIFHFGHPSVVFALSCCSIQTRGSKTRSFGTAATATTISPDDGNAKDTFFAGENVSWASLGVSNLVAGALTKIGLFKPFLVQVELEPALLRPRVVVYDGVCHLCHQGVKWAIEADKDKKIKFCCLQSKAAEPYLSVAGVEREDVLRRFLFVEGPGLYHQGSTICGLASLPSAEILQFTWRRYLDPFSSLE